MIPSMEPYLASTLGALILLCLGVVIRLLTKMSDTLTKHGETVVVLHTILIGASGTPGLVDRVNSLHEWRNAVHARELQAAATEIVELKRRAGDRA